VGATAARRACTAAGVAPVTSSVNVGGVTPGNEPSSRETRIDWLPGTSQPPPERWSVWWSENQPPAASSTSQAAITARRRRATAPARRARELSTNIFRD